ncbi:MAG: pyrroline-5-carboxylate reductase [Methanophagales archaeon]|nr:pyrroline-5-carboxylate reductase [Methanophagales archaeon]
MNESAAVKRKKIGIIGIGKIGASILRGLLFADDNGRGRCCWLNEEIFVSDTDIKRKRDELKYFEGAGGRESRVAAVCVCDSNGEVAEKSDVIILAVKPNDLQGVVKEIAPLITGAKILVSVAAGVPTSMIESYLGEGKRVIRVMPNIGAHVGESVTALCTGKYAEEEDESVAKEIFGSIGTVYNVKEGDIDVITGLSGSGIAFFAVIIEAMADAGLHEGLPGALSLEISARTALSAAKMILAGDKPSSIKEMTASPGGTTIRGLYAMESSGVKAAMMDAVIAATKRARAVSNYSGSKFREPRTVNLAT